jgi:hypothetical protein
VVNVEFSTFHEGRGAGKSTTPGGRIIVSEKRIVTGKEKLREKNCYRKKKDLRQRRVSWRSRGNISEGGGLVLAGNVGENFFPSRPWIAVYFFY